MKRRILHIFTGMKEWRLETLHTDKLKQEPHEDYFVLGGEPLCQYLLRRDKNSLIIARGPLPFITGNKTTVGYISPLTNLPHYSIVGGRSFLHLLNLGLDAIVLNSDLTEVIEYNKPYIVISGRTPNLLIEFKSADNIPSGQRSAYYYLLENELNGNETSGSIFTIGEGIKLGYRSANLGVDVIYHAGRGGAGIVFAKAASALVLRGIKLDESDFFIDKPQKQINKITSVMSKLWDKHCDRLSRKTGGTIIKMYATGFNKKGKNTLPAYNARQLGYSQADIGGPDILKATRESQTGCHWCQVNCRHWHKIPVDYTPNGYDILLDDFEPAYSINAMLGLKPKSETFQEKLNLLKKVDKQINLPIEQMGCDIMNIGTGLSALFEGVEKSIIPENDIPSFISKGKCFGNIDTVEQSVKMLRTKQVQKYKALQAVGDGPNYLVKLYPEMKNHVFTCGNNTIGNAGHCNSLWTFLMPFSRFFGHYVGQCYKISEVIPPIGADDEDYKECFRRVINKMLEREFFWILSNTFSMCAFTFVIFSQDGKGQYLSNDNLLIHLLREYGIYTTRDELNWFTQAFWAQSIDFKCQCGWKPPNAEDLPFLIYETLSQTLNYKPNKLQKLMNMLISEWKQQAGNIMKRFGYKVQW